VELACAPIEHAARETDDRSKGAARRKWALLKNINLRSLKEMIVRMPAVLLVLVVLSSPLRANLIQNGSFATGDFTDWTRFTTTNGSLGIGQLPRITSFDVSGTGPTIAAEFQVGQITPDPTGSQAGGGIKQVVTTDAGSYSFSADIAALSGRGDPDAGSVSVLMDGIPQDTVNFGPILDSSRPFTPLLRDTLAFTITLSSGMHELEILVTRSLQTIDLSPDQFITNITLVDPDSIPEPATWPILGVALAALMIGRHRLSQHQGQRRHLASA
jgi:hypothetical protein